MKMHKAANSLEKSGLNYGNWISNKLIIAHVLILLTSLSLSLTFLVNIISVMVFTAVSFFVFLSLLYLMYARFQFSPRGNDIQNKIYNLILEHVDFSGRGTIIDIGCGNGPLAIRLAKKYHETTITGIDYWEGLWDYSKETCELNAAQEGVRDRVTFVKASASSLTECRTSRRYRRLSRTRRAVARR